MEEYDLVRTASLKDRLFEMNDHYKYLVNLKFKFFAIFLISPHIFICERGGLDHEIEQRKHITLGFIFRKFLCTKFSYV